MGDRRRAKQLIVLVILLLAVTARAQQFSADTRSYFDYGDQSYVVSRQSPTADSLRVFVNTAHALFSFLKTDRTLASHGAYFAVRDISVEIRDDATSRVLATRNVRDTIFAREFSETTAKQRWESKVVSVSVASIPKPAKVDVRTEIRDGFLARPADRPVTESFVLRAFTPIRSVAARDTTNIGIGDPILFDAGVAGCNSCARNFGAATEFARDLVGVVPLAIATGDRIDSITLSLYQESDFLHTPKFERKLVSSATIASSALALGRTVEVADCDSLVRFIETSAHDSAFDQLLAPFRLAGERLEQGDYTLKVDVHRGSDTRTITSSLELEWHDMPLSLQSARDAVPPMQYILTDAEYSAMSSGSNTEQMKKLFGYWKSQDPTAATAFNERMAEFYRRADYAYFNCARNTRQLDGAMTDRGKIYILFGPPTSIQRSFLVGEQPVEQWSYSNNVKKVFRFVAQGSGEFKLIEVKSL